MLKRTIFLLGMFFVASSLCASDEILKEVSQRIEALYPSTTVSEVRHTPVDGIYEIVMGRNIAYTNQAGRYFFFGHLFDMASQKDLTAQLEETLNRVDLSVLPLEDSLKTVHGKGERILYLFSDPDCPFCKRLEQELQRLDNVTIHTFLYPIDELHPDAAEKSRRVWCARDPLSAWNKLMEQGESVEAEECSNPIKRIIKLAKKLGINGTPTMFLEDGEMVQGYMVADELDSLLQGARE